MDHRSIEPLNTGQQNRRGRRKRLIRKWVGALLRKRLLLLTVLRVAQAIVKLAQLIGG